MQSFLPKLSRASLPCLAMLVFAGCGGNKGESVPVTPPATSPPAVKAMLNDVATTGELGSGAEGIRQALTDLKTTDPAKADGLLKEMDELEAMKDPAKIKAKAKSMADKL